MPIAHFEDFFKFPFDIHTCCAAMYHADEYDTINVKFILAKDHDDTIPVDIRTPSEWRFLDNKVTLLEHKSLKDGNQLMFCARVQRRDSRFVFKYAGPLAASFLVAVFAPLFGGWGVQVGFKSLALLMLSLFFLVVANINLPLANSRPLFMIAYEFMLLTTTVSLLLTLIFWTLSMRQGSGPVPRTCQVIANIVSPLCGCYGSKATFVAGDTASFGNPSVEEGVVVKSAGAGSDWAVFWQSLNSIFLVLFTVVYLVGIAVIAIKAS